MIKMEKTVSRLASDFESFMPQLVKAVLSQPIDELSDEKVIVRPITSKTGAAYQVECFRGTKVFHSNLNAGDMLKYFAAELDGRYRQALIISEGVTAQYSLKLNGSYKRTQSASLQKPGKPTSHNREKNYILSEGENIPALVDLGVFSADFHIVKAKYDKYKQINRFIELVDQRLSGDKRTKLTILDFGCGKSYLTFILYYYLTVKRGLEAEIIGYDLKADVVEKCNAVAEKYGYSGLHFVVADVTRDALYDKKIDMVVTLHACDTATDYALFYALTKKTDYIFSVPCCQHEVNLSIKKGGELDIFLEYGIIKERVCALLTDTIRANILESCGYKVDIIEFTDFEHSPKNLMLRAVRNGRKAPEKRERAVKLAEKYNFSQTLLKLTEEAQNK